MVDFDIVVVGSGGAGNAAAVEASAAGASVLMVEAASNFGGATALSGGVFLAAGTSVQRAAGIEDSPDLLYETYMTYNRWQLEPALVRRYCDEAGGCIEWLISLGIEFAPEALYNSSIVPIKRGHVPTGYGQEVFSRLHGVAISQGTEVVSNTRVTRVITEDGVVVGVEADGDEIRASAVILACGGLGAADQQLLGRYYPDATLHGNWHHYIGPSSNRGDGIALGLGAGAVIARNTINRGLVSLAPHFEQRVPEASLPAWLMFVNRDGRRFIDETAPYAVAGDIVNKQPDKCCFALFDNFIFENADGKGQFAVGGSSCPNWEHTVFESNLAKGRIVKANTLQELAQKIGVHGGALQTNVERYNGYVENRKDEQFFKDMRSAVKIKEAPFYATEVRAVSIALSAVGILIDANAQVHDACDKPIPGLYAAGEAAGGVVGYYFGGGIGFGPPIVFGRVAGRNASTYVQALRERGLV
jgi:fumarate reductase flavoprotein subunit